MWSLNSLVALLAISHLSIVSFSLLNYANNKLNKKKLHKEQELLVKHCFCVTFTFLLCKFPVELQFRVLRVSFHPYFAYAADRFAWQTFCETFKKMNNSNFIPILTVTGIQTFREKKTNLVHLRRKIIYMKQRIRN